MKDETKTLTVGKMRLVFKFFFFERQLVWPIKYYRSKPQKAHQKNCKNTQWNVKQNFTWNMLLNISVNDWQAEAMNFDKCSTETDCRPINCATQSLLTGIWQQEVVGICQYYDAPQNLQLNKTWQKHTNTWFSRGIVIIRKMTQTPK